MPRSCLTNSEEQKQTKLSIFSYVTILCVEWKLILYHRVCPPIVHVLIIVSCAQVLGHEETPKKLRKARTCLTIARSGKPWLAYLNLHVYRRKLFSNKYVNNRDPSHTSQFILFSADQYQHKRGSNKTPKTARVA